MFLAPFHAKVSRRQESRASRPLRGAFAEGFDTADLKDAKALLEELSG
jgi:hypothetical protein